MRCSPALLLLLLLASLLGCPTTEPNPGGDDDPGDDDAGDDDAGDDDAGDDDAGDDDAGDDDAGDDDAGDDDAGDDDAGDDDAGDDDAGDDDAGDDDSAAPYDCAAACAPRAGEIGWCFLTDAGFGLCQDWCEAERGLWDAADRAAFDVCAATNPLCFETAETCVYGPAPAVLAVSPLTAAVAIGDTATFTITLSNPARPGGFAVGVTRAPGAFTSAPSSLLIPEGDTEGAVDVTGVATGADSVTFTGAGTLGGVATATVTVGF